MCSDDVKQTIGPTCLWNMEPEELGAGDPGLHLCFKEKVTSFFRDSNILCYLFCKIWSYYSLLEIFFNGSMSYWGTPKYPEMPHPKTKTFVDKLRRGRHKTMF